MSYEGMTIAELRALAKERGVELQKSMKKAEVIAAIEAEDVQEVEAEVIDDDQKGLAVSLLPGELHANFADLDARIDGILADYEGWEPSADTADDLKQVARERKYLNSIARELDERRKDIKREYLRPLTELEGMFNSRRDRIKAVSDRLQAVEREADEERKRTKEAELREHFEAVAGLLADVVAYEQIADPKWMNKTPGTEQCKRELEDRCRKAASDWETLKALNLEFSAEAELRFFQTLDLGDATSYASKLAEDKRRLEAMKAEREQYAQMQAHPVEPQPVEQPAPVMQPEPVYQPEPLCDPVPLAPEPVMQEPHLPHGPRGLAMKRLIDAVDPLEAWQLEKLAEAFETVTRQQVGDAQPRVMVMESATIPQLQAIGMVCGLLGVTGTMKSGTLSQVFEREFAKGSM